MYIGSRASSLGAILRQRERHGAHFKFVAAARGLGQHLHPHAALAAAAAHIECVLQKDRDVSMCVDSVRVDPVRVAAAAAHARHADDAHALVGDE
eukprot:2071871-Pleurochrysis_carterae.AAC.1